jgi:hypothetical protein
MNKTKLYLGGIREINKEEKKKKKKSDFVISAAEVGH